MIHLRKNMVALGAAVILAACGRGIFAQDDLDDLLNVLEAEATATVTAPAASTDAVAADETPPADEPVADAPVADEPVADEPVADEPVADEPVADEPVADEPVADAPVADEPVADEPVADEPVADEPVADEPVAEEPVADEPVADEPVAEEPVAEEPVTDEPADEEPVAEEPVTDEPVAEEPVAEEPVAEEPAAEEPVAEEPVAEEPVAEEPATEEPAVAEEPVAEEPASQEPAVADGKSAALQPEDELIENIRNTERLRRKAWDDHAKRVIESARKSFADGRYVEAVRSYNNARKFLTDTEANAGFRAECEQGMAEGLYRAAMQEWETGRRDRAKAWMSKAVDMRHRKARRQLEVWNSEEDPDKNKMEVSEVAQRRNDQDYKDQRAKNLQHLKRSRQLLGTSELDQALEECELVLVVDPYNKTALALREKIEKKRHSILLKERQAAREGMMADVDKAWRPVYAKDARELEQSQPETVKSNVGSQDPTRAQEQSIIKRMKEMRLPQISFKPPATIIEAVEYFRGASKDYDSPEKPLEQRGFNFYLKPPETLRSADAQQDEESGGFGSDDSGESGAAQAGVPVIPMIAASDISFYEALKLVCDSVGYKFKVQGPIVMVMDKDATIDEMITRSYSVVAAFMERMGAASSDLKEMRSAGFGGNNNRRANEDNGDESTERDWKAFFEELGVKWPEGSSIMYLKTIGKLRVKNTYDNLAELEKALVELNASPRLIEIETRFVEVCQEDLNSLGFEWILNSDYSIGLGKHVSRALGLRGGAWGSNTASETYTTSSSSSTGSSGTASTGTTGGVNNSGGITTQTGTVLKNSTTEATTSSSRTILHNSNGSSWIRNGSARHGSLGLNGVGGKSDYSTNMRYLSTDSNHISGESKSNNDQFMRVNAFLGSADLSMILHMLSQRSDTDLLSAPKVLTRNGEEAVIKVVTEYIYPTDYDVQLQSSSSSGSSNGGSQSAILAVVEPQSFTMREVGVILDVTPTLTDDGHLIDLKLNTQVVDEPEWHNYGMRIPFTGNASNGDISFPELPAVLGDRPIGEDVLNMVYQAWADTIKTIADGIGGTANITYYDAPMEQPWFHVRSIDTSVSVYPGATIVMGGLITEQRKAMDDKIPFLGDLPFVGRLFRSHSEQTSKRNLLIFVTTRLVDVQGREVKMVDAEQSDADAKPDLANLD